MPFADASFDVVTLLAVLEHLAEPRRMVEEIARVLRPGGQVVLTVPSHAAKPVLEFLAYRLHVVSEAEIRDHKRYYGAADLRALLQGTGLAIDRHRYFQLGMNNFLVATRSVALGARGRRENVIGQRGGSMRSSRQSSSGLVRMFVRTCPQPPGTERAGRAPQWRYPRRRRTEDATRICSE